MIGKEEKRSWIWNKGVSFVRVMVFERKEVQQVLHDDFCVTWQVHEALKAVELYEE